MPPRKEQISVGQDEIFGGWLTQFTVDMEKLQWLRLQLVAQVSVTEWTNYGLLRHATFLGLRDDKEPKEVVKE